MIEIHAKEAVSLAKRLDLPEGHTVVLHDLIRRVQDIPTSMLIWDEVHHLASISDPLQIDHLVAAAHELDDGDTDVARLFVDRILNSDEPGQTNVLSIHQVLDGLGPLLAKIGTKSYGEQLPRLLGARGWELDKWVCRALRVLEDHDAEEGLLGYLGHLMQPESTYDAVNLRLDYTLQALATCATKRSADPILRFLRVHEHQSVDLWQTSVLPLVRRGVLTLDQTVEVAVDPSASLGGRITCVYTLGEGHESVQVLQRLAFTEGSSVLRAKTVRAIGFSHNPDWIPLIRDIYATAHDAIVLAESAEALGRLGDTASVGQLEQDLDDDYLTSEHAHHFVIALGQLGERSSVPVLLRTLHTNPFGLVRRRAIEELGRFEGDPAAMTAVNEYLDRWLGPSTDFGDQEIAVKTLSRHAPLTLLTRATRLYDLGLLSKSARRALAGSLSLLMQNDDVRANSLFVELIMSLLRDMHIPVRQLSATALPALDDRMREDVVRRLFQDGDGQYRKYAVEVLGYIDSDQGLLENAMHDADVRVRHAAEVGQRKRRQRQQLREMVDRFLNYKGIKRLQAYYVIRDHGDEETLRFLNDRLDSGSDVRAVARDLADDLLHSLWERRDKQVRDMERSEQERGLVRF